MFRRICVTYDCTLFLHESAFSSVLYPVHFLFTFEERADNEHERMSFSSRCRKRDRAYATTIIGAHRNVRTYRHIIAGKKEYGLHVFENFQTAKFCCFSCAEEKGAHLDNFIFNVSIFTFVVIKNFFYK